MIQNRPINSFMISHLIKLVVFAGLLIGASIAVHAQSDLPDASTRDPYQRRRDAPPTGLKEMMAKQRAERDKKDHEEMLERGDEALSLAKQLEASFSQNKTFTQQDRIKLESLEKVVTKIRRELGGDDDDAGDGSDDANYLKAADEPKPSNMEEAFRYLQSTTIKLVDELKKTTRFSISAIAIQSSNTVLKLIRFVRLKK
jgi:hypothetical protein